MQKKHVLRIREKWGDAFLLTAREHKTVKAIALRPYYAARRDSPLARLGWKLRFWLSTKMAWLAASRGHLVIVTGPASSGKSVLLESFYGLTLSNANKAFWLEATSAHLDVVSEIPERGLFGIDEASFIPSGELVKVVRKLALSGRGLVLASQSVSPIREVLQAWLECAGGNGIYVVNMGHAGDLSVEHHAAFRGEKFPMRPADH